MTPRFALTHKLRPATGRMSAARARRIATCGRHVLAPGKALGGSRRVGHPALPLSYGRVAAAGRSRTSDLALSNDKPNTPARRRCCEARPVQPYAGGCASSVVGISCSASLRRPGAPRPVGGMRPLTGRESAGDCVPRTPVCGSSLVGPRFGSSLSSFVEFLHTNCRWRACHIEIRMPSGMCWTGVPTAARAAAPPSRGGMAFGER
jgi:hypothetical protein